MKPILLIIDVNIIAIGKIVRHRIWVGLQCLLLQSGVALLKLSIFRRTWGY